MGYTKATQKKLLTEGDVKLNKAVEIAQSMKTEHKNAQALKASAPDLTVDAIESSTKPSQQTRAISASHLPPNPCYCCGQTGHFFRKCETICHMMQEKVTRLRFEHLAVLHEQTLWYSPQSGLRRVGGAYSPCPKEGRINKNLW